MEIFIGAAMALILMGAGLTILAIAYRGVSRHVDALERRLVVVERHQHMIDQMKQLATRGGAKNATGSSNDGPGDGVRSPGPREVGS